MLKHDFKELDATDIFVAFEGHENSPFWDRGGIIYYVVTNLSFKLANVLAKKGDLQHSSMVVPDCTFDMWISLAEKTHADIADRHGCKSYA